MLTSPNFSNCRIPDQSISLWLKFCNKYHKFIPTCFMDSYLYSTSKYFIHRYILLGIQNTVRHLIHFSLIFTIFIDSEFSSGSYTARHPLAMYRFVLVIVVENARLRELTFSKCIFLCEIHHNSNEKFSAQKVENHGRKTAFYRSKNHKQFVKTAVPSVLLALVFSYFFLKLFRPHRQQFWYCDSWTFWLFFN